MLGHANLVAQTSTYLNATRTGLQDSMRRFGRPAKPVAKRQPKRNRTPSLHGLAPEANVDHPPAVQGGASDEAQPTVN
jgi:hypothetical protein